MWEFLVFRLLLRAFGGSEQKVRQVGSHRCCDWLVFFREEFIFKDCYLSAPQAKAKDKSEAGEG